jgi:hypothetical protein
MSDAGTMQRPVAARPMTTGAFFSECRAYRYALWRDWDWQGYAHRVAFIGLNPSTADETQDDPTIRRCIGFAKAWGFGGLVMLNAYAFRATDPKNMRKAADPIGPANDEKLAYYATQVGCIVAAWGGHCSPSRERRVVDVVRQPVFCLGVTKDGRPKHPLYLPASAARVPFTVPH